MRLSALLTPPRSSKEEAWRGRDGVGSYDGRQQVGRRPGKMVGTMVGKMVGLTVGATVGTIVGKIVRLDRV